MQLIHVYYMIYFLIFAGIINVISFYKRVHHYHIGLALLANGAFCYFLLNYFVSEVFEVFFYLSIIIGFTVTIIDYKDIIKLVKKK